jgi:GT2 family glycosyltransferase
VNLSIIIVNWNSQEHLKKCVASILEHTRRISFEIIVIDSASFDGCDRMLHEHFPQVRFVQSRTNLGFAGANNRAFGISHGKYVLFLNPDTELVGPAIETLYAAAESLPHAGVIGCRLLNADRTLQSSCVQSIPTIPNQLLDSEWLRARWPKSPLWGMAALFEADGHPHPVEAISGACLMVKRQVFETVGCFSEDYFMYAEDMDLSFKVREAGYINYYVPGATVIHYGGGSSEQVVSAFAAVMIPEAISRFLCKTRGRLYSRGYRVAMGMSAAGRLMLLAAARAGGRREAGMEGSIRKWLAVLRWSVNRDDIVHKYYPAQGS